MTSALLVQDAEPGVLAEVRAVHAAIDALAAAADAVTASSCDAVVVEVERAARRLESVRLRVIAAANRARVAERTGLADTSAWLARRVRAGGAQASSDVRLATALDDARPCATALATGAVSADHARVIVKATEQLPESLGSEQVREVERHLVARATDLSPEQLRRVARRALEAVEPDASAVDHHEDALLRAEERSALARSRLTWHDNEDGTTSGHFTVPTAAAAILIRAVQSMTSPRRAHLGAPAAQAGDPASRRDWAHSSGLAFTELLEHLPTDRLSSKVAATVVVTVDLDRLRTAIGAAHLDVAHTVSAGEVRRLACGAGILPAVLDGRSLPLDLGRTSRLFSEHQRVALATRYRTCAAAGCERSIAWCELHHRDPWAGGGRTDLADAVPFCGFHHRRIHDPDYEHAETPGGFTFRERR